MASGPANGVSTSTELVTSTVRTLAAHSTGARSHPREPGPSPPCQLDLRALPQLLQPRLGHRHRRRHLHPSRVRHRPSVPEETLKLRWQRPCLHRAVGRPEGTHRPDRHLRPRPVEAPSNPSAREAAEAVRLHPALLQRVRLLASRTAQSAPDEFSEQVPLAQRRGVYTHAQPARRHGDAALARQRVQVQPPGNDQGHAHRRVRPLRLSLEDTMADPERQDRKGVELPRHARDPDHREHAGRGRPERRHGRGASLLSGEPWSLIPDSGLRR